MPASKMFGKINTEASLWILLPQAAASVAVSFGLVLLIFWLEFDEVPGFAYGFAVFLVTLQVLMIVGLRFSTRTDVAVDWPAKFTWLDKIGGMWLFACALGPFLAWVIGSFAPTSPDRQTPFHISRVILTIVLPILTLLPNLRYLQRNAAHIQVPLFVGVTALPVIYGLPAALSLLQARIP